MLFRCVACSALFEIKDCSFHYKYVHGNAMQAAMQCTVEDCGRVFTNLHSARKHVKSHIECPEVPPQIMNHCTINAPVSDGSINNCQNCNILDQQISNHQNTVCDSPIIDEEKDYNFALLKKKALSVTSRFYADPSLSRVQVQRIVQSFEDFLNAEEVNTFRDCIINAIPTNEKEFASQKFQEFQSVFEGFNSEHKRLARLEKEGYYIPPVQLFIGTLDVSRRNGTMTTKDIYCQYIPIKDTIKSFMETPGIYYSIRKYCDELEKTDNSIENIAQSKFWKQKNHAEKQVLPLLLYQDDFETGNPLGSRAGIHKLNGTYLSIGCIPPAYRSKLLNVFLVQLCHSADYKKFDCAVIFKRLIDDLNDLAENGIQLNIGGSIIVVYFKLAIMIGDNLGLNSTLGFTESFSANFSCRLCKTSKVKSKQLCSEVGCVMRNRENYTVDLSRKNLSLTGIRTECIWNQVVDFHAVENFSVDIMHDLLEGIGKLETALLLKHLIVTKKYLTLENLNSRIKYFKYPTSSNPPPLISDKELSDGNIRMTAGEMKTFMLHAGLMFGDLIAANDKHWELYILLRKILSICLQTRVSCNTANSLESLIEKHHRLYVELHGNTLKPKHHHMLHYPRIMREIGPLRHIWSMRFEANHRALKKSSAVSFNRVNICKTLAVKNQLNFSYAILCRQFFATDITFKARELKQSDDTEDPLLRELDQYTELKKLSVNSTKFSYGDVILVRLDKTPVFGEIRKVLLKKGTVTPALADLAFLVLTFETVCLNEHLQAYEIVKTKSVEFASFNPIDDTEKLAVVFSPTGKKYIACDEITNCV